MRPPLLLLVLLSAVSLRSETFPVDETTISQLHAAYLAGTTTALAVLGAGLGATTSVFPFDSRTADYLNATFRADIAKEAQKFADAINADSDVHDNAEKYYDQVIEIDLDKLEPMLVGPHTPDKAHAASNLHPIRHEDGSAWVKGGSSRLERRCSRRRPERWKKSTPTK